MDSEPPAFDEDFVKGAVFTEPSARERGRRPGRLKWWRLQRAAKREARRRRRVTRGQGRRRGSRFKTIGKGLTVAAVLALIGGAVWTTRHGGPFSRETRPVVGGPVPALAPENPFEGSPAASYADGEAGINVPGATAVGVFTADDMVTAYATTRRILIATALDRQTLLGGSPDAFAKAVGPDERSYFVKNLNNPDVEKRTRWWVVSLAPGTAELVGKTIKVNGTMSAAPNTRNGTRGVDVKVDYLFVYPIRRPGAPATLERLVVRVRGGIFYYRQSGVTHLWSYDWVVSPTPARCDVRDGFIHPTYDDSPAEKVAPSGAPMDPYDRSGPARDDRECRRATRT